MSTAELAPADTEPKPRRYKLTVAYDGSGFHGWQKQEPPGLEPLRTVQGELENALVQLLRQPREIIALLGASRTDTGVHAIGQACQFHATTRIPLERLHLAINARLPEDIEVHDPQIVSDDFDVIRDVESKQYRYRLFTSHRRPLGIRHLVHHAWEPMQIEPMQDAAARFVGTHDLAGFAAASHGRTTTIRTVHDCRVEPQETDAGPELHIVVSGSGFLYHTVRILAGTLVDVGRGRFKPEVMDEILNTGNRRLAGPTLPPTGLCLEWIRYRPVEP